MSTIKQMLKSFSTSNLIPTSPMSQSDTFFFKINPISIPNTEGKNPIIIYKKKKKIPSIFDLNLREMGYVTDGGLKKKQQRFDGIRTFSKQGISLMCTPKQNNNFASTSHLSRGPLCQSMKDINPKKMSDIKSLGKSTPKAQRMSCCDRKSLTMKNLQVNSPSNCSSSKNGNHHRRCLSPEIKYEQMDELVKKAIAYKFREITTERGKKSREEEINERKQKYLEENGVEMNLESLENDDNSNNNDYTHINEDKAKESNTNRNSNTNSNNYNELNDIQSSSHQSKRLTKSNQLSNSNSQFRFTRSGSYNNIYDDINREKRILKPRVDNLEYINKINNEARRLSNRIRNNSSRSVKTNTNNNNNSFRKSSSSNNKHLSDIANHSHSNQIDNKTKHFYHQCTNNSNNLLSSYHSHRRSEEELPYFTLTKKMQKEEREQREVIENNKKLFMIYKNLATLSQRLQFKPKQNNNNHMKKKMKIKNDFYIGKTTTNNSNINNNNNTYNNNSTIIDPDDFYYSVIEGQKLIVKSDFDFEKEKKRKKDLISGNGNSNTIINRNKIKKEQIQKISKELGNNSTNNNESTAQFSELQQRAMKTILRTNDLLSHENIELIFKSEKSSSQEKQNENIAINNEDNGIPSRQQLKKDIEKETEEGKDDDQCEYNNNNLIEIAKSNQSHLSIHSKSNKSSKLEVLIDENNYTISYNGTKEKNLPSLSHTYTINNTNTNNKKIIEPRAVLNLVAIIKILLQRKIFYMFYEDYFNEAMIQRYTIAFVYFNALLKQRTFHRIACFANYKLEYYAITQLFKPFIKQAFHSFVSRCNYIEKIKYLRELLVHIIKKKSIERIYVYGYVARSICDIFSKVLTRPMLQDAFEVFVQNSTIIDIKTHQEKEKEPKGDIGSKVIKDLSSDKILNERLQTVSSGHSVDSDEKRYIKNKMNTYAYESLLLKSEYSVEPNSVDSDRLHRLHKMILEQNEKMIIGDDQYYQYENNRQLAIDLETKKRTRLENDNNSLQNSNSAKSVKSLKDICLMKPGIDLSRSHESLEKTIQKSRSNKSLKKALSNRTRSHHSSILNSRDENMSKEDNESTTSRNIKKHIEENEIGIEKEKKTNEAEEDEKNKQSQIEDKQNDSMTKENKHPELKGEVEIIPGSKKDSIHTSTDHDISAEKDIIGQIEWELSIGTSNIPEKKIIDTEDIVKSDIIPSKDTNSNIDQICKGNEIDQLTPIKSEETPLTEKNPSILRSPQKKTDRSVESPPIIKKKESIKDHLISPNKKQTNSSNNNSYINDFEKESISEIEEAEEDNIVSLIQRESTPQQGLSDININELTEQIISRLLLEIKDQPIVPHKTHKFELVPIQTNNSNSFTSSSYNPSHHSLSLGQLTESSYNSLLMNYTALSLFSKTVKDKKKERSLNLYMTKIYPKLIAKIKEEIRANYSKIYKNLSTPIRSIPEGLMTSLALEDAEMLRDNFKRLLLTEDDFQMLNKARILSEFEAVNKKIRLKDNVTSDNYYDNQLNECIIDTAIELLNQERLYGETGEPLPWGTRIREIEYKYSKIDPTRLVNFIEGQLFALINKRVGMISENFDYMEQDQLNNEREKKLLGNILAELNETEYQWINLEMEESQIKIEVNELIIEQLYHEVIEIIEHIQYSRKHPEFYQHKSIYSCEDIPKLECQLTSENTKEEDNEYMNM